MSVMMKEMVPMMGSIQMNSIRLLGEKGKMIHHIASVNIISLELQE